MNARTIRFIIPVTAALAALACLAADTPPPWLNTTRGWYDFKPANDSGPSVIGMQDWLEKPAGTRGGVRMVGDHFEFADGTRVKFWGVNLGNMDCAPDKPAADTWADRYAKYGVNCVRLHKFINSGSEGIGGERDSTKYDPRKLDQLDYFSAKLKSNGMYFGWSHSYHFKVRPGDRARLVAYDEIETKLKGDTLGLINAAEDVQDVMIAAVLALLAHTNAYTGIPYAKEPALAFIEFQNEDDILFYSTTQNALDACPTYKRLFVRKWNAWLTNKYRTEQALEKAWGKEAFDVYGVKNESLEKQNIALQLNGWFMGNAGLTQAVDRGTFVRLVDNAAFLHEQQNAYYSKFLKALRDAGYEGPTVGSCWQAPAGIASYYNLLSDYLVGFIDRHNYFGGMGGYRPVTGTFRNEAHVTHPGSGLLSSGLQQVVDRPFALSEWASVFPNEWYAESPVMIAAYGLGLQGWDASYQFASSTGRRGLGYQKALHLGTGMWLTEIPTQIGMYPLIARMVYRNDVAEGAVISTRRVSPGELRTGKLGFVENVEQEGDFKSFSGDVPPEALAAGRVVVQFVDAPEKSTLPDMKQFKSGPVIKANNGQLAWDPTAGDLGCFVINTKGTKGVVGFPGDRTYSLGSVKISVESPFAVVLLTSLEKDRGIDEADSLLLGAVARVHNSGMRFNAHHTELTKMGDEPMIMEPVKATVTIPGRAIKTVRLLDHDGRATEKTIPANNHKIEIDGAVDKTFYYEITLAEEPPAQKTP